VRITNAVTDYPMTAQTDVRTTRIAIAFAAAVIGVLAGPVKFTPGGPFVSLIGDVLPVCASVFAIGNALPLLRNPRVGAQCMAVLALGFATLLLGFVLLGVVPFALAPHSRGTLFSL
jgi:hypothetical protein